MEIDRRQFVVGTAAVVCATCTGCDDGGGDGERSSGSTTTTPGDGSAASIPAGFGAMVDVGPIQEVRDSIAAGGGFRYVPEARAHLVAFPEEALEDARAVYDDATIAGMELGLVALYQKCTHLGCRVPECRTSGRFECQCHGAVFSSIGEAVGGPAPRGLDRFAVMVERGRVVIDTSVPLEGAPLGTRTVDADPDGVPCLPPEG